MAVLKDYGIADKILGLTADGAPNVSKAIGMMLPLPNTERTRKDGLDGKLASFCKDTEFCCCGLYYLIVALYSLSS